MTDPVYVTIDGMELVLCQYEGAKDLWIPADITFDGPTNPRPLSEWRTVIAEWKVAKQKAAGFKVWNIKHDNPKYWELREAVFRKGLPQSDPDYRFQTHEVYVRNGHGAREDSIFCIYRGEAAMDTPETKAAIEHARALFKAAQDAWSEWKKAKNAIKCLPEEEWMKLPQKPEKFT